MIMCEITSLKEHFMNKKIAIIGGGNLGTAIAEGLIQSGFVTPKHILITKRNIQTLNELERKGVLVSDKNEEAVRYADLVIDRKSVV